MCDQPDTGYLLWLCVKERASFTIINHLVNRFKADVNYVVPAHEMTSVLDQAILRDSREVVKLLVGHGAEVSCLHISSAQSDEVSRYLKRALIDKWKSELEKEEKK